MVEWDRRGSYNAWLELGVWVVGRQGVWAHGVSDGLRVFELSVCEWRQEVSRVFELRVCVTAGGLRVFELRVWEWRKGRGIEGVWAQRLRLYCSQINLLTLMTLSWVTKLFIMMVTFRNGPNRNQTKACNSSQQYYSVAWCWLYYLGSKRKKMDWMGGTTWSCPIRNINFSFFLCVPWAQLRYVYCLVRLGDFKKPKTIGTLHLRYTLSTVKISVHYKY